MVATISTDTQSASHGLLRRSISDYTAGQLSKHDIRSVLAKAIQDDPACVAVIEEFLDRELTGRRLSSTDHKDLLAGLDVASSENVPTETTEGVPEHSGLYRIDDEGTLILSEDFEPEPPPSLEEPKVSKPAVTRNSQPKPAALEVGSVLRERFRLDEEVASGSMGLVYRATDLLKLDAGANSPIVAVKVINPEFANNKAALKSFQNEVTKTQLLSHPNIIHLFELDRDNEHYFITMEWLEGEALDTLLDRSMGSALPPVQTYAIIEQLCDALAYAHARNVVHADIKPGNVFLTKPGELKLIDFGIAHIDESEAGETTSSDRTIALTPAYASCEALEKQKPTQQDDLFSLACLVYRLLSGRRAFGSLTALQAEAQGVELVPIGGISDSRWAALSKALSFRRADRQSDVNTFATEFGQREAPRHYANDKKPVEDVAHTETTNLQELPEGALDAPVAAQDEHVPALSEQAVTEVDGSVNVEMLDEDMLLMSAAKESTESTVAEQEEQPFVDTLALGEGSGSDTVSLESTAPLPNGNGTADLNLLGTDVIGEGTVAPEESGTGTEDLGNLPEPINFFDDNSDDSAFIPLDSNSADNDTLENEQLPEDSSFLNQSSGPADAPFGGAISIPDDTAAPAPGINPITNAPIAPPAPAPAPEPKAKPQPVVKAPAPPAQEPPDTNRIVASLTGAERATKQSSPSAVERSIQLLKQKPLFAAGGAVGLLLTIGVIIALVIGGEDAGFDPAIAADVGQNSLAPAGAVEPTVLTVSPGRSAGNGLAEEPVYAADAGIAGENAAVAVPLSLSSKPASGTTPAVGSAVVNPLAEQIASAEASGSPGPGYMIALNSLARQALLAGNLVAPADASATYWLDKMLAVEPNSLETLAINEQVIAALFEQADLSVAQREIGAASSWIALLEKYGAASVEIDQVRSDLSAARAELEREQAKAREAEQPEPVQPQAYEQPVSVIPVPLADIEFTRYAEPVFPDGFATQRVSGWVDLSFTIGVDGGTRDIKITGSNLPAEFNAPSFTAVAGWQFEPYRYNGVATPVSSAVRLQYAN